MELFFYTMLFMTGLLFWSFSSVMIHSLKSGESWIMWWSSHCPKCNTTLKFYDLFPIFSWLSTLWKCSYCKNKMSVMYPILELSTWLVFAFIWYFLMDFNLIASWNIAEMIGLTYWLIMWFMTIMYIFYDMLFLEMHEWVMFTWMVFAFLWLVSNSFFMGLLPTMKMSNDLYLLEQWLSMLLWMWVIWALYMMMIKELKTSYDMLILSLVMLSMMWFKEWFNLNFYSDIPVLSWLMWAVAMFLFFFLQIVLSWWSALWWWDLSMWMMIWLMLWMSYSFAWMMLTYFVWSFISIFMIIYWKMKTKGGKINTQVPFGPFLWLGFLLCMFFLNNMSSIMESYFSLM